MGVGEFRGGEGLLSVAGGDLEEAGLKGSFFDGLKGCLVDLGSLVVLNRANGDSFGVGAEGFSGLEEIEGIFRRSREILGLGLKFV